MRAETRRGIVLGVILVVAWTLVGLWRGGDEGVSARQTVAVMGTGATVEVWAESQDAAQEATDAVVREFRRMEALLSSWTPDSEIGRLNAHPVGVPFILSTELAPMLDVAGGWSRRTGGAFQPVVGALIDAWGLRGLGRFPSADEMARALAATGASGMVFDAAEGSMTRLDSAAWLDTGAFGKGAALATAADTLRTRGVLKARVDLGGQLLILGGDSVAVGVAHPSRREEIAMRLSLLDVSVATSGQSERYVEVDGERLGHIIDPRSGEPAPAWGSVTVVSHDPLLADILATAFLVLGPGEGMPLALRMEDVGVLFLVSGDEGIREVHNPAMTRWLRNP